MAKTSHFRDSRFRITGYMNVNGLKRPTKRKNTFNRNTYQRKFLHFYLVMRCLFQSKCSTLKQTCHDPAQS